MRRLLALVLLFVPAALAGDFDRPMTILMYWERPLGTETKRDSLPYFGFRVQDGRASSEGPMRRPLVDFRFNERGFKLFAFRGSVLHQNQPASGGPAPEINWWLVGGIAIGTAVVVRQEVRKSRGDIERAQKFGGKAPS